jgi:hypothetical protein
MISTKRSRHSYDHRLRDLVRSTGNVEQATSRGVPRSTARGRLSARPAPVVTLDVVDQDLVKMQQQVLVLRRRADRLLALLKVFVVLWKLSGYSVGRNPDPAGKLRPLAAIDRTRAVMPLRVVLSTRMRRPTARTNPRGGAPARVVCSTSRRLEQVRNRNAVCRRLGWSRVAPSRERQHLPGPCERESVRRASLVVSSASARLMDLVPAH